MAIKKFTHIRIDKDTKDILKQRTFNINEELKRLKFPKPSIKLTELTNYISKRDMQMTDKELIDWAKTIKYKGVKRL
jgi:hypothetical protein